MATRPANRPAFAGRRATPRGVAPHDSSAALPLAPLELRGVHALLPELPEPMRGRIRDEALRRGVAALARELEDHVDAAERGQQALARQRVEVVVEPRVGPAGLVIDAQLEVVGVLDPV